MITTRALALLALLALAGAGCSHKYSGDGTTTSGAASATDLVAPRPTDTGLGFTGARTLYPLAVGNKWTYHIRTVNQITTTDGPQQPVIENTPLAVEIASVQTVDGLRYFQQDEYNPLADPGTGSTFVLRGNREGLFELDNVRTQQNVSTDAVPVGSEAAALAAYVDRTITDPVQRAAFQRAAAQVAAKLEVVRPFVTGLHAATGARPGEITLLAYPVFPGARWVVRQDPRFGRVVVGRDRIHVPLGTFASWKIRGTSELFGPDDRVHFWYSNLGLLRIRFHVVGEATDATGNVIGTVVTDSDQSLTDLHLVRPGPSLAADDGDGE